MFLILAWLWIVLSAVGGTTSVERKQTRTNHIGLIREAAKKFIFLMAVPLRPYPQSWMAVLFVIHNLFLFFIKSFLWCHLPEHIHNILDIYNQITRQGFTLLLYYNIRVHLLEDPLPSNIGHVSLWLYPPENSRISTIFFLPQIFELK